MAAPRKSSARPPRRPCCRPPGRCDKQYPSDHELSIGRAGARIATRWCTARISAG